MYAAPPQTTDNADPRLRVRLTPSSPSYSLADASQGAVLFVAEVWNPRDQPVVLAHPAITFPGECALLHNIKERHGKSEILLTVRKPGGETVILRDGPHFFDPGNNAYLVVPAKGSQKFDIGWFFQNQRGRWERDDIAATLFTAKGSYTVTLLLRNKFTCAILGPGRRQLDRPIWTGEMRSNRATIAIR